ncbi:MAG TPA: [protein-PII] uridylyltransferase [Candidatus Competibacteraceae bacterium]|nr:[protein-PII] uridylyltransferase [Candidatus Competibacteraceae bacterium]HRZ07986.1 [protein-PII] uridylyltransferase [Candidatus Competibacteraceae bacterium]
MSFPTFLQNEALWNQQALCDAIAFEPDLTTNANPITSFRTLLKKSDTRLKDLFQRGVPAYELVLARAQLMDELLQRVWLRFFTADAPDLALVAVGGYGRGELHPGSDVDIMILLGDRALDTHRSGLEDVLTFLWDIGLEVGHSVRTVEDCAREGAADITIATSLMEARLLTGSSVLFEQMRAVTGPDRIWPDAAFFEFKQQERCQRCRKYNETAFNLEPNIKEGPGGLRDLQMIGWVAKRHFGASTLQELVSHGFLSPREYDELLEYRNFLWQIRFALHTLTGRREDVLLFDHQRRIAQQFGYEDQDHNLAVEQFMQRYYRTVNALSRLNEMLLQLFEEAILLADESGEPTPINRRFQARRGYLEVTRPNVFLRYPFALLEIFLILQQHPELKGIRASTIRLIRDHQPLIDDKFRNDVRPRSLFMEILRQPYGVTQQLRLMSAYGVLPAYLPEFGHIMGRMQYDLFHAYTVDQHILFVVRNLRRFFLLQFVDQLPQCSAIMERLPKPELLYIAGLYHDIAKGRGGDHSELGAEDAERFCRQHGLSSFDARLVAWLVRHHLTLSITAQKKDTHDPDVIHDFARQMGDQMHLDYLYLLTVADIRATNPKLWNTWRASLLWQLYEATRRALRRGLDHPIDKDERIREVQNQARRLLHVAKIDEERINRVWEGFGDDYFLRHSADEITWHTRSILKRGHKERPLVMARDDPGRGGTEIFIYTRDQDNLFALITSILDQLGLTVLDARIITGHSGYTLDSFTVLEDTGLPIQERSRIKEIVTMLIHALQQPDTAPLMPSRHISRIQKAFQMPTCVSFHEDTANSRTVVELVSWDRPGLLCRVGQAFMESGVQLHNAKIMTVGARAEDVFFVTDRENRPLNDSRKYMALRETLVAQLDSGED